MHMIIKFETFTDMCSKNNYDLNTFITPQNNKNSNLIINEFWPLFKFSKISAKLYNLMSPDHILGWDDPRPD